MVSAIRKTPVKRFETVGNMVIISVLKLADETPGGVVLPESAKDQWETPQAVVIAAGPECKSVKEGDTVLISPSTRAMKIRIGTDEYLKLCETQIDGILLSGK